MLTKFCLLLAILPMFFSEPAIAKTKGKTRVDASILAKYKNCKEANSAGIFDVPVSPGYTPPGWSHSADRDKDGIACEKKK
jgi:hypothetical protein